MQTLDVFIFSEIPLFHVLNARITFGNIFAMENPADGVTLLKDNGQTNCCVDERCFDVPTTYSVIGMLALFACHVATTMNGTLIRSIYRGRPEH